MSIYFIFLFLPFFLNALCSIREFDEPSKSSAEFDELFSKKVCLDNVNEEANSIQNEEPSQIWAVLVAGSSGWDNYRHQADVCHAYHILRSHGVPAANIITMMYDDIAHNKENPYKGKIYNKPSGRKNVYEGVKIDYTGKDVTPENFAAVLLGDESGVDGGNGRVLKSTKKDKVFVNFVDHGGVGIIGFPDDIMSVKNLTTVLHKMNKKGNYNELVFYMEACESGSMFKGLLQPNLKIYAVTAANGDESSWACYCDSDILPGTCLGDEFSVNWMEDSDKEDLKSETVRKQYLLVKNRTTLSHVCHFGDMDIENEEVSEFQGGSNCFGKQLVDDAEMFAPNKFKSYASRDVVLKALQSQFARETSRRQRKKLSFKIRRIAEKRDLLAENIRAMVKTIVHDPVTRANVLSSYPDSITQLSCHHDVMHAFNSRCLKFARNPYALNFSNVLANFCELLIPTNRIVQKITEHCAKFAEQFEKNAPFV